MNFWICKTEPEVYSIDDLKKEKVTAWDSIRNYQARNFMRDGMKKNDIVFIYHSNAEPPGLAGLAKVSSETAKADLTAFDKKSDYYDPKSKKEAPTWVCPDLAFVEKFSQLVPLNALKENPKLKNLMILRPGNRLSVTPVAEAEARELLLMAGTKFKILDK